MTKGNVGKSLEDDLAGGSRAELVSLGDVDPAVGQVGDGTDRGGNVVDGPDLEIEGGGQIGQVTGRDRSRATVPGAVKRLACLRLDRRQVAVRVFELAGQGPVGSPYVLGGGEGGITGLSVGGKEGRKVLYPVVGNSRRRPEGGQAELGVERVGLDPIQFELEGGPAVGWGGVEKQSGGDRKDGRQAVDDRELWFSFPILKERQIRGRLPHQRSELLQGERFQAAEMPQSLAEGGQIADAVLVHSDNNRKTCTVWSPQ